MNIPSRLSAYFAVLLFSFVQAVTPSAAQDFPNKRVTLIVPLQAGGAIDVLARLVASPLEERWHQPVVVENRPGANMMTGTLYVAKSAPDGHMLLLSGSPISITRLFTVLDYSGGDLKPAVQLVRGLWVAAVSSEVPAKTVQELITYAKAHPKAINYGTISYTTFDLDFLRFMGATGIEMTPVPYQGTPVAAAALARNDIQFYFAVPQTIAPFVTSGKVVVLATTSAKRSDLVPGVPTMHESGVDFEAGYSIGLFAQSGTPDRVVSRIGTDAAAVMRNSSVEAKAREFGFEVSGMPGAEWNDELMHQFAAYSALAQQRGIKPQ